MTTKDTTTHDDPLMQIQQSEEKVRWQLAKKEEENTKKIEEITAKGEESLKAAEEKARSAGNKKIDEAKAQAQESLKNKLATVERDVLSLADKAETSREEAADLVITSFESELKA